MARKTIKELYTLIESPFLLDADMTYPEIEGNTSNFLEYYDENKEQFDRFFVHEYGKRYVDFDADDDEGIAAEWADELDAIQRIYLDSWARLWYALNIDFNPVFNVEEHTVTTYGEDVTTNGYGQHVHTDNYAQRQDTQGQRTDTATAYSVSYDSGTEKKTGKQSDQIGQQVNTIGGHIDTHTETAVDDTVTRDEHVDHVDRSGNNGTVSATDLLIKEEQFRRNYSFFKNCFLTIVEELGAYWDDAPCFM